MYFFFASMLFLNCIENPRASSKYIKHIHIALFAFKFVHVFPGKFGMVVVPQYACVRSHRTCNFTVLGAAIDSLTKDQLQ